MRDRDPVTRRRRPLRRRWRPGAAAARTSGRPTRMIERVDEPARIAGEQPERVSDRHRADRDHERPVERARAPTIVRANRSRPRASVPIQKCPVGPRRAAFRSWASGPWGRSDSRRARARQRADRNPRASMIGIDGRRRRTRHRHLTIERGSGELAQYRSGAESDPRIESEVDDVRQQVHGHDHDSQHDDEPLHHRDVLRVDGLHQQRAEPLHRERHLYQHRPHDDGTQYRPRGSDRSGSARSSARR